MVVIPVNGASAPDEDLRYWLALLHARGVGTTRFLQILEHTTDLAAFFSSRGRCIEGIKLPSAVKSCLTSPDWRAVDKTLAWADEKNCHILCLNDPRYPHLLKEISDPPPLLFVRGSLCVLNRHQLAMVGSRNPSAGGKQLAQSFAQALSLHGFTITSGLALGIDAESHQAALDAGHDTIAVAGTGLDRIYPARHRELGHRITNNGAIVSEFAPGTPPIASNFPRRNRIISGLSLGTLVVEAALKSGSLITARLANEQGREVFAIPGSIHNPLSRGCHSLIQQGAKLTSQPVDIIEEFEHLSNLHSSATVALTSLASSSENKDQQITHPLLEKIGFEPISIDTLVDNSGLTAEVVSSMLLTMELQGIVTSSGGLYTRINTL
ncbi:MAG: DNA-protecting protein DprA [Ectothiorhodospiraceae bacterium]|nr:DNA-protecting protein DprA [Ectothiorhodospiraceae bacterium]